MMLLEGALTQEQFALAYDSLGMEIGTKSSKITVRSSKIRPTSNTYWGNILYINGVV